MALLLLWGIAAGAQPGRQTAKALPATENMEFICENYAFTGKAYVQILKTDSGGQLRIAIGTRQPEDYVGGTAYVYLVDNTYMVCTDKGIRQNTEGQAVSLYHFSKTEMLKLQKTDIQSVRFTLNGAYKAFGNATGNFTAVNKKSFYGSFGKQDNNRYATAEAIKSLYVPKP